MLQYVGIRGVFDQNPKKGGIAFYPAGHTEGQEVENIRSFFEFPNSGYYVPPATALCSDQFTWHMVNFMCRSGKLMHDGHVCGCQNMELWHFWCWIPAIPLHVLAWNLVSCPHDFPSPILLECSLTSPSKRNSVIIKGELKSPQ